MRTSSDWRTAHSCTWHTRRHLARSDSGKPRLRRSCRTTWSRPFRRGLWAARARRGGPGDRGAAWGPVVARRLAAEPRGEGSGSSSPAPALPARAHTSSLTHFAAQAVIWRQRRQPRLPGARFVLEASEPGDGALRRGAKQLAQSFLVDFCFFIVSPNLKTEVLEPWG